MRLHIAPVAVLAAALAAQAQEREPLEQPFPIAPGRTRYYAGLEHLARFDLVQAQTAFTAAITEVPASIDFAAASALVQLLDRHYAEGRQTIERALQGGTTPNALVVLAFALLLHDDLQGGWAIFREHQHREFDQLLYHTGRDHLEGKGLRAAKREEAIAKFPTIARAFAEQEGSDGEADRFRFARGMQRRAQREYAGACADFAAVLERQPDAWAVRHYYAAALTGIGQYEKARVELSLVLCQHPCVFESWCQRAIAAARMGNLQRARSDLALARTLADDKNWLGPAERTIAETEAVMPKEAAKRLFQDLLAAAAAGKGVDELRALAVPLVRKAHARRLGGDEVYQDKLHALQWAALLEPRNAGKQAALGRFLLSELDVRGEYVDPGKHYVYYRTQSKRRQQQELEAARAACQQALALEPGNVPALMGLAEIKYRENQFGDAEGYARQALAMQGNDPAVLDMMSRLMRIAAGQQLARALAVTSSQSWTEHLSGVEIHWVQYPSVADHAAAGAFGRSADNLLAAGSEYIRRALASLQDTPECCDFVGTLAMGKQQWEPARKAYQRAVAQVPADIGYRYALANACARLNQFDDYLEQATIGRNLEQTTVGAHLLAAWQRISGSDFAGAQALLQRAIEIDPGDSRNAAYLGAIAEGQGQADQAAALFRAALAMAEADCALRGVESKGGPAVWGMDDVARAVALRIRLARLLEEADPKAALRLYQQNLAIEPRLDSVAMVATHADAMLPEAGRPAAKQAEAPSAAGLLRTSRALAGLACYRLGDQQAAAVHWRQVNDYERHMQLAKVPRGRTMGPGIWTPRPYARVALELFQGLGEPGQVRAWQRLAQALEDAEAAPAPKAPTRPVRK